MGYDTVLTDASEHTVSNSTVASEDTAKCTKGDSSANTPRTNGAKVEEPVWSDEELAVELAGFKLNKFILGHQKFPTVSPPDLDSEHVLKYLGDISRSTAVSLLDSYSKSIHQPWQRTPYHEQQMVWKDTMARVQQLCHAFHKLKLKG